MDDEDAYAYVCHDCLRVFLHERQFEQHEKETGHGNKAKVKVNARIKLDGRELLMFELV